MGLIDGSGSVNAVKDIQKKKLRIRFANVPIKWFVNGFQLMDTFMFWK